MTKLTQNIFNEDKWRFRQEKQEMVQWPIYKTFFSVIYDPEAVFLVMCDSSMNEL